MTTWMIWKCTHTMTLNTLHDGACFVHVKGESITVYAVLGAKIFRRHSFTSCTAPKHVEVEF